jgi:outer membrane biosynthesis protein TonB
VSQVEVVATEPGHELDRSLRRSLLGHVVESSASVVRGNAQVGAATATGGDISNLNRVVAGMRAGFRNCYQRALADAPAYAGKLNIKLTVDAQGGVPAAKVTSPQYNAAVFACVEARAQASQFAPPEGGKPATVTFSVTLSKP